MTDFRIGEVTHYYDKIKVAILELSGNLAVGDKVKFVRGDEEVFDQVVKSIQVEHEKIDKAGKGDVVGMKVKQEVKEGAEVFRIQ